MKDKIDAIEKLALELRTLGNGVPVIEKNVRAILGFTHVLKFGVSDMVENEDAQGGPA
jgi:hypothetical protein